MKNGMTSFNMSNCGMSASRSYTAACACPSAFNKNIAVILGAVLASIIIILAVCIADNVIRSLVIILPLLAILLIADRSKSRHS